jgi:hypothetical protein
MPAAHHGKTIPLPSRYAEEKQVSLAQFENVDNSSPVEYSNDEVHSRASSSVERSTQLKMVTAQRNRIESEINLASRASLRNYSSNPVSEFVHDDEWTADEPVDPKETLGDMVMQDNLSHQESMGSRYPQSRNLPRQSGSNPHGPMYPRPGRLIKDLICPVIDARISEGTVATSPFDYPTGLTVNDLDELDNIPGPPSIPPVRRSRYNSGTGEARTHISNLDKPIDFPETIENEEHHPPPRTGTQRFTAENPIRVVPSGSHTETAYPEELVDEMGDLDIPCHSTNIPPRGIAESTNNYSGSPHRGRIPANSPRGVIATPRSVPSRYEHDAAPDLSAAVPPPPAPARSRYGQAPMRRQ